jgi:site-specific DNA-methyltransferase (adenine-specific)
VIRTGEKTVIRPSKALSRPRANIHPTVKPLDVMRWLVRLVSPPGGLVLDPFTGSGSTGCAAVTEGRRFLGVEREVDYLPLAQARLAHWTRVAEPVQRLLNDGSARSVPGGESIPI